MFDSSYLKDFPWNKPSLTPSQMALIPPEKLMQIETQYLSDLFNFFKGTSEETPLIDSRFKSPLWNDGSSEMVYRLYLINSEYLTNLANGVESDEKTKRRIQFSVEQWIDMMSPANFLATNPEAIQQLISTNGMSLTQGINNLLNDLSAGKISQTASADFQVGKNIASSEGKVVYQNPLFELIQYKPLTKDVFDTPYLMIPPCINKCYILDLQPETSMIRYLVSEGHTVFIVSWKNADLDMINLTWDDYVRDGVIEAIKIVVEISKQPKLNIFGFCVGGTLLSSALAVLAAKDVHPAKSLTLITSFLDFSDTGLLDIFIDKALVELRESSIGGVGVNAGLLSGIELANTFSFLRPNDLVWNYVVGNYLLGKSPPAFDLLFWNGDSTNLPGPMYCWYLRHMYLQNELKIPNRLTICGSPVDLGKINCPVYIYASKEDHIVPWKSAFGSTTLLKGNLRFVLGASGHIAGVINPPIKNKRNYWVNPKLNTTAEEWIEGAQEIQGSWWIDYIKWIKQYSGKKISSKKVFGSAKFPPLRDAPGLYVLEKPVKV